MKGAVELCLVCTPLEEIERRLQTEVFVTRFEAAQGSCPVGTRSLLYLERFACAEVTW